MNTALKALQLKAKQQVYTLLSGHNLSDLYGEGYDFAQLREYQIGDDIRKINWMVTAKLGKPYIKELHSNRELSVVVAALMDGSLYFNTHNNKQTKLTEVATLLSYATLQQNDLFTGLCYTQEAPWGTPPTKQIYEVEQFLTYLLESKLLYTTLAPQPAIEDIFQRIEKPSLIFLLGDFLEEVDVSLLAQKHEVIAIIIRDEEEEHPQQQGEVTLHSPTDGQTIERYFGKKSITDYLSKLHEHDKKCINHFSEHHVSHIKISTQEDALTKLLTLF